MSTDSVQSKVALAILNALESAKKTGLINCQIPEQIILDRPKNRDHGDYATSIALTLAKAANLQPRVIAEVIIKTLSENNLLAPAGISKVEIAGPGFINITLESASQGSVVIEILTAGKKYGQGQSLAGKKINLEFVSANPTGPIHLGHTRWAAVGDSLGRVLSAAGGDVTVLAKAIGYDPRIGNRFLQAGIGFGGGCLPKDIRAFMARAQELGADQALEFLREIDAINLRARQRVIDVVRADLSEDLTQYKIAVLGATFKPDSDDVRDSPALDIAAQLQAAGATVVVHDPKGIEPARKRFPNLDFAEKVADCVKGADAILHLTEWKEYRELDPSVIGQLVKSKFLIDGRNMLDRDKWRAAGWRVHALGRTD